MTKILIDRAVVEQALEALETPIHEQSFMQKQNATTNLRAALAEPQPNTLHDWVFKRNADGSIGIFAPPPRPGESQRTSDCVGPGQRDLHELLGKLADHMAALAEPVQEPAPMPPFPPVSLWKRGCAVCGIGAGGHAYGYACPRSDCPTRVTCGGTV